MPPGAAQGLDLSPLFDAPATAEVKNRTLSQFPSCGEAGKECMACTGPRSHRTSIAAMGSSREASEPGHTVVQGTAERQRSP